MNFYKYTPATGFVLQGHIYHSLEPMPDLLLQSHSLGPN